MSTIAFVTVPAGGNIPPFTAIGRTLHARGHDVHVVGHSLLRTRAEAEGFAFTALRSTGFFADRAVRTTTPAAISETVRLMTSRRIRSEVADTLGRLRPDVVLVDALMATAVLGASDAGVPTATLFHAYYAFWRRLSAGPLGWLARARGVDLLRAWSTADEQFVVSDPVLDPAGRMADTDGGPVWLGSIERGVAAPVVGDQTPLVLASLSSTWFPGQTDAYQRIATALGSLPVRGLITLGGVRPDRALTLPPNIELRDRIPHADVMPAVSLVVGHGRHSTTFTALAHGKPLVFLPMHPLLDQPMVAESVERAGAGIALTRSASSAKIAQAVSTVLSDRTRTEAAERIGERLRSTDAAADAADRLLQLATAPRIAPTR